jgi:hypothetical protein
MRLSKRSLIAELDRKHGEAIEDNEKANIRNTGKGEAEEEDVKRIKLNGGQVLDHPSAPPAVIK